MTNLPLEMREQIAKQRDVQLWQADPHQFGPGKTHALDPEKTERTYCGKITSAIPGRPISVGQVTCKVCIDGPARRQQAAEREEQVRAEQLVRESERESQLRDYRDRYHAYLQTDEWRGRSRKVLERAKGLCEGCLSQSATEAHHLTYEHIFNEFLWELRAVCRTCHERFHAGKPGL